MHIYSHEVSYMALRIQGKFRKTADSMYCLLLATLLSYAIDESQLLQLAPLRHYYIAVLPMQ
jgi:hypothetical protein